MYASEANKFIQEWAGGKTPTITGWETEPTDLANVTDGDYTSATGIAQVGYAGATSGTVKIDLGSNVNHYKLKAKYIYNTVHGVLNETFALSVSENDSDWTDLSTSTTDSETPRDETYYFKKPFRYVRFSLFDNYNPGTQFTLHEVQVF